MLNKNQKGFLLAEETLKTIIAVIVILFLIYFLISLYFGASDAKKQENSQKTLNRIQNISAYGTAPKEVVPKVLPVGWYFFSFTEDKIPKQCAGKKCLCICDDKWFFGDYSDSQVKECSEDGACVIISNLQKFDKIEIEKNMDIYVERSDNKIIIRK